jgi:predicted Zn-dependent peptidase
MNPRTHKPRPRHWQLPAPEKLCHQVARALLVLVILAGGRASAARPPGVKKVGEGSLVDGLAPAEKFIFDNGLKLIVLPDNRNPVATLRIRLDAGSNRERPGITGLAHFFEHMMFRKTKGEPEGLFDKVLSGIGGNGNAATSTNYVVYESTFPGPALDNMLDLEKKRFLDLDLTDPYFSTEKGAVISERRLRYENNPMQRGLEFIRRITERGTPREWMTIGTREDVENMSIKDADDFYRAHYVPSNTLISVGGPFKVDDVVAKVHARFGGWAGDLKATDRTPPKDLMTRDRGKVFICRESVTDQFFQVVFPSMETAYEDLLMAHISGELLDDHEEGDYSRRLTNANLASAFSLYKTFWQHAFQPVAAYFTLSRDQDIKRAYEAFATELEGLKKKSWGKEFRQRLQKNLEVDKANAAEKMTTLVESYEFNEGNYNDFLVSKSYQNVINDLSERQLRKWMEQNLDLSTAYIVGISPDPRFPPCDKLTEEGTKL